MIAIAFGGGKESLQLMGMLAHSKPLLITCFAPGEERKYKKRLQEMADSVGLKIIFIRDKDGFKENWEWDTEIDEVKYDNTILRYYRNKKKPFDVLYVGRRAKDIVDRFDDVLPEDLPKQVNVEGVKFPLWSE